MVVSRDKINQNGIQIKKVIDIDTAVYCTIYLTTVALSTALAGTSFRPATVFNIHDLLVPEFYPAQPVPTPEVCQGPK